MNTSYTEFNLLRHFLYGWELQAVKVAKCGPFSWFRKRQNSNIASERLGINQLGISKTISSLNKKGHITKTSENPKVWAITDTGRKEIESWLLKNA